MPRPNTGTQKSLQRGSCFVAVIWIDWYAYHVARFRGMLSDPLLEGKVQGIEMVGGVGVHKGLQFREDLPVDLPVETLVPEGNWQNIRQLTLAKKVWAALSQIRPDVVLVPGYYTLPALAAALWARLHQRQSVLMTESTAGDHVRSWWKEVLKSIVIRSFFNWAITGGKTHVQYLKQLGFRPERVLGSYDVVDNDFFETSSIHLRQQTASSLGLPEQYFLYVGRLSPEKNVDGLLAEWNAYREQGGRFPLVIVGGGSDAEALGVVARASPFKNDIHFVGHKSYRELPQFYAFARCFVLPSKREPWGLVVNEAMASGLSVIVSDRCGCSHDLVHDEENGYTFDPYSPGTLAKILLKIELQSPADQTRMSNSSKQIISSYSPTHLGAAVASIVSRTVAEMPPASTSNHSILHPTRRNHEL